MIFRGLDQQTPRSPRACGPMGTEGLNVPNPGRVGQKTKALLCQASISSLLTKELFNYSTFLFTENLSARGL